MLSCRGQRRACDGLKQDGSLIPRSFCSHPGCTCQVALGGAGGPGPAFRGPRALRRGTHVLPRERLACLTRPGQAATAGPALTGGAGDPAEGRGHGEDRGRGAAGPDSQQPAPWSRPALRQSQQLQVSPRVEFGVPSLGGGPRGRGPRRARPACLCPGHTHESAGTDRKGRPYALYTGCQAELEPGPRAPWAPWEWGDQQGTL